MFSSSFKVSTAAFSFSFKPAIASSPVDSIFASSSSTLLAKENLKVLVIDKDSEENLCKRLDIFHFTRDSYKQFDIEESVEGDEEFVRNFDICYSRSAKNRHQKI